LLETAKNSEAQTAQEVIMKKAEKPKKPTWIKAVLPFNIAIGPVSTLVALLILNSNGTVINVSLAVTLFNAVSIPSAIFWGFVTDRFHDRKLLIMSSYIGTAMILLFFLFADSFFQITLLYALFSFVTTAVTTPLNLLVMETSPKQKWSTAFAWFSMVISIGNTLGLVLSAIWSAYFILEYIAIPLAILSLTSGILSALLIKEPSVFLEREVMIHNRYSFFARLKHVPFVFLRVPKYFDFKRVFRTLKNGLTLNVPVLILSIFMFYVAAGIFNTSLVPSLAANRIPSIAIFGIVTTVNIVQILSFRFAGSYDEKNSLRKVSIVGLTLRSTCYALTGICFFLISGEWLAIFVAVLYSLAGGVAYSIYYTAANTMVFNTVAGHRGNGYSLGVYSALVGIATMVGSLISGLASFYLGFGATFLLAGASLTLSIWLVSLLNSP
jgi:MFS family permease